MKFKKDQVFERLKQDELKRANKNKDNISVNNETPRSHCRIHEEIPLISQNS